jgi:hypothetical protein
MPQTVKFSHDAAIAELNRMYREYDKLTGEYNELLRNVKIVMSCIVREARIRQRRLERVCELEEELDKMWIAGQNSLAWKRENEHLWKLLEWEWADD